jgi:hypothetical protein
MATEIAVVGNGTSLTELSKSQINTINSTQLFRCNWCFQDPTPIKRNLFIYFAQAYKHDKNLTLKLHQSIEAKEISFTKSVVSVLYIENPNLFYLDQNGDCLWATSGLQMLHYACRYVPKKIYIAGIDFYTHGRKTKYVTHEEKEKYLAGHGISKNFGESPRDSIGIQHVWNNVTPVPKEVHINALKSRGCTTHNMVTDILFLIDLVIRLDGIELICYGVPTLELLIKTIQDNTDECRSLMLAPEDPEQIKASYRLWRFVTKLVRLIP